MKKNVLWWSDGPTLATGFATVARNMLAQLYKTGNYRFTVVGISYYGDPYDGDKYPYIKYPDNALYPAGQQGDIYGRGKLLEMAKTGKFDVVFLLNDTFIVQTFMAELVKIRDSLPEGKRFKIVYYFPIDSTPKKEWVDKAVRLADYPVVYTNFGKKEVLKIDRALQDMPVIYHGTNKQDFNPIPGEAGKVIRQAIHGPHAGKFIVLCVNRNQPRKDFNRTFASFAKFHKKNPNSYLYVLAAANDAGGNLFEIADQYGLIYGKDWNCPPPNLYSPNMGVPVEVVNQIYNSCDLVITTTTGEGWGLSITEAMAVKKPVLAPKNTSLVEMIGENGERGTFAACGDLDHTVIMGPLDNNRVRPVVDVDSMADEMTKIMKYPGTPEKKAEKAFKWVQSWEDVCKDWEIIFAKAAGLNEVQEEKQERAV